jgi:hypothetical protein
MWVISAVSTIGGGAGWLGFWPAVALTTIWNLVIMALALRCALLAEDTAAIMARMTDVRFREH